MRAAHAAAAAAACTTAAAVPLPAFPRAYSVHQSQSARLEGASAKWVGTANWDLDNNRTSYITDCTGPEKLPVCMHPNSVYDYAAQKIYYVTGKWGTKFASCDYYCDMLGDLQCNLGDSLCPYDYTHAKFNGSAEVAGETCDELTWDENLGPIPMASIQLYVRQGTNVPVRMWRDTHFFGKKGMGSTDINFTSFSAVAPPDAAFTVPGADRCMMGENAQCANALRTLRGGRRAAPRSL